MMNENKNRSFIFDRSHLGEAVYAPLYRKYSGDYVFEIEKSFTSLLKDRINLIVLVADAEEVFKRDDGLSFYKNTEEVKIEIDAFIRAYSMSSIERKIMIDVTSLSKEEVLKKVIKFLEE